MYTLWALIDSLMVFDQVNSFVENRQGSNTLKLYVVHRGRPTLRCLGLTSSNWFQRSNIFFWEHTRQGGTPIKKFHLEKVLKSLTVHSINFYQNDTLV